MVLHRNTERGGGGGILILDQKIRIRILSALRSGWSGKTGRMHGTFMPASRNMFLNPRNSQTKAFYVASYTPGPLL